MTNSSFWFVHLCLLEDVYCLNYCFSNKVDFSCYPSILQQIIHNGFKMVTIFLGILIKKIAQVTLVGSESFINVNKRNILITLFRRGILPGSEYEKKRKRNHIYFWSANNTFGNQEYKFSPISYKCHIRIFHCQLLDSLHYI